MLEKPTTQELMNQLTDRLILKLENNEIPCPTCKGLRFVFKQEGEHGYINSCPDCYNGKQYTCKYCGESHKTDHCDCEGANNERRTEEDKKELERFNKAEKIHFDDYSGYFLWNDRAIDKDDLCEELYNLIYDGEEYPKYLYATTKDYIDIQVDLYDEIDNKCADGYEDMIDYLNMKSDKLKQAQGLIDEWIGEQGKALDIYYEDYKKVVLLDDVIEEIKREIAEKRN